jgi:hypothetical protein
MRAILRRSVLTVVLILAIVSPLMAEGGTVYLYRSPALPAQEYRVIANRQVVGSLGRNDVLAIHSASPEVLLYIDTALPNPIVSSYAVFRIFVADDAAIYVEIDGNNFVAVESAERIEEIRAIEPVGEADVP